MFGKSTALQLLCTGFLSFAWLTLHIHEKPYFFLEVRAPGAAEPVRPVPVPSMLAASDADCGRRVHRAQDNVLKALCEVAILATIQVALVLLPHDSGADGAATAGYSAGLLALYVAVVPVCVGVIVAKVLRARAKPTHGHGTAAAAFSMCLNGTMTGADRAVLAAYLERVSADADEMQRRWQARLPRRGAGCRADPALIGQCTACVQPHAVRPTLRPHRTDTRRRGSSSQRPRSCRTTLR